MKFFKKQDKQEDGKFPMGYQLACGRCFTSGKPDGFYLKIEFPKVEHRWYTDPATFESFKTDCQRVVVYRRRQPRGCSSPRWFRNELWTPTALLTDD